MQYHSDDALPNKFIDRVPDIFSYAIEQGFEKDFLERFIITSKDANLRNKNMSSLLHVAVKNNCEKEIIEFLINKGTDVNSKDADSCTPLHFAIYFKCRKEIIELLINKGADVNSKGMYSLTPLRVAVQYNCEKEIIELLLNKGADVNSKDDNYATPLHYLTSVKHKKEIIELLINYGADVNSKNNNLLTPLQIAFRYELEKEVIKLLINKWSDIDLKDDRSLTLLHYAIGLKYEKEVIELLINKGVDVNSGDMYLLTPLHYAIQLKREKEIIELLISNEADVNSKDVWLLTPLHYAIQYKCKKEIIELLINKGADVNSKNARLLTPLHCATFFNCEKEIIELLINKGADINSQDIYTITPLHFAVAVKNSSEIIDLFIKNDAHQIILFPLIFTRNNVNRDDKYMKYLLNNPKIFHIDIETAIKVNFSEEDIILLLKNGVNLNIGGLTYLITMSENYEQLKGIKQFEYSKSFFINKSLSKEENYYCSLIYDKHLKNMRVSRNIAFLYIIQLEATNDIDKIIEKCNLDITIKTKNSQGILILNSYYYYVYRKTIPRIREELIIPRNLSFDYAEILKHCNKIDNNCRIYKGIAFSITKQIKENKYECDKEEYVETEKGNNIIHIQAAFNRDEKIKTSENFIDEYINFNGWNPLFTSIFHNNSSAQLYFQVKTYDRDYVDYFGNTAQFYELKLPKH